MTKKERERQEKINHLNEIVDKDIEYDARKEHLVLSFIFNILASNIVMNRYEFTRFGSIEENDTIGLTECINYVGKKLREKGE